MRVGRFFALSAVCCVIAVGVSGCGSKNPGGFPGQGPAPVITVTLKAAPVTLTRELPGRTSAFLVAEVRPQANGIIKQRLFTEGGMVKAGQALYTLDDAPYRARLDSSMAASTKAEATAAAARLAAKRSAELVKIEAVSTADNENAIATLGQAEGDAAAARAAVATSRVDLGYTRIVAPITGRIGKSSATPGALVVANQSAALATVQQLDPIYVDVSQSSAEWLRLRQAIDAGRMTAAATGTSVAIVLEDASHYAHEGKLQFADVSVDPATGSYVVRAIVPNPDSRLLPGMFVTAVIDEGTRADAILVPEQGIAHDPKGGATALVVGEGEKAELRSVVVSRTVGDQWLVESGLKAGDRVIVEGLQKVQPGAPVNATERGAVAPPVPAK